MSISPDAGARICGVVFGLQLTSSAASSQQDLCAILQTQRKQISDHLPNDQAAHEAERLSSRWRSGAAPGVAGAIGHEHMN
nr:unnamed protein product [Callosobruchus chinensis]